MNQKQLILHVQYNYKTIQLQDSSVVSSRPMLCNTVLGAYDVQDLSLHLQHMMYKTCLCSQYCFCQLVMCMYCMVATQTMSNYVINKETLQPAIVRVLARIIFKRAKNHVATTMTAVSGPGDIFSEVSNTGIFLQ
jgi:hypothetical protein